MQPHRCLSLGMILKHSNFRNCLVLKFSSRCDIYWQSFAERRAFSQRLPRMFAASLVFKVALSLRTIINGKSRHEFLSFNIFARSAFAPREKEDITVENERKMLWNVNLCGFLHVWIMEIIRQLYDFSPLFSSCHISQGKRFFAFLLSCDKRK